MRRLLKRVKLAKRVKPLRQKNMSLTVLMAFAFLRHISRMNWDHIGARISMRE